MICWLGKRRNVETMWEGDMQGWKNHGLFPRTLAWIVLADARVRLPVVWYGCLSGSPARLVAGLREEVMTEVAGVSLHRFVLYRLPARAKASGGGEGTVCRDRLLRLECQDGRIEPGFGLQALCGRLERVVIGRRCFDASRFDFGLLLHPCRRADG
jgi:SAM-dependent methyltransferase